MTNKLLFAIYVLYCFEVGLFLIIFPWMEFWKHNFLLYQYPILQVVFLNNYFRGAVSGLGLANIILGVWEIAHIKTYFKKS
jgi:hypothetical protein